MFGWRSLNSDKIVGMDVTFSVNEDTLLRARRSAEALGKTLEQIVCEYVERLGLKTDLATDAAEFRRLSLQSNGRSQGWRFDREEIHKR
jgi:hypothetical protein